MTKLIRVLSVFPMVFMLAVLPGCRGKVSVEAEVKVDPSGGLKGSFDMEYEFSGEAPAEARSSSLLLALDSSGGETPKLLTSYVEVSTFGSRGEQLGQEKFEVAEKKPGLYVFADPDAVDAWLAKFEQAASVGAHFETTYSGRPFKVTVYGDGVALGSGTIGEK